MSKKQFKSESKKLMDMMINSIYTHKEIFLRELISNASDALDKLYFRSLTDNAVGIAPEDFEIRLEIDKDARTLKVIDNGCGMTEEELDKNLGTIAKSGSFAFKQENEKKENVDIIGQFGVGFYSAFMVADKVEITTRRAGEDKAWVWISDGVGGFEISEGKRDRNGTSIKLFLKEDAKEFTDTIYLRQIIRTYSDHIDYPIVLDLGKAGEETVNTGSALWAKHKSEITQEQYKEFYHHISKNFDEPWLTLHFKAEGNIEYTGLLYVPSTAPYDLCQ